MLSQEMEVEWFLLQCDICILVSSRARENNVIIIIIIIIIITEPG